MSEAVAPVRLDIAPLLWFALVYIVLQLTWWYAPVLAEVDLGLLDIVAEIATFGCAVAIAGFYFKTRRPNLTKRDRHVFALGSVAIVWAVLITTIVVESFLDTFDAWSDLLAQVGSASLGLAIAAAVAFVVLFISNLYYFVARLMLHFVAPPKRIAAQ